MLSVEVFEARIASGLAALSSLGEDSLLQLHALEHGFDHDIGLLEAVVGDGAAAAAPDAARRIRASSGRARRSARSFCGSWPGRGRGVLRRFLEHHWNSGVDVGHGDAAAHRARADDGRFADLEHAACPRECRGSCAPPRSPKKAWISAFDWSEKRHSLNNVGLAPQSVVKTQPRRRLDGVDRLERSHEARGVFARLFRGREREPRRAIRHRRASRCGRGFSAAGPVWPPLRAQTTRAPRSRSSKPSPGTIASTMPSRMRLRRGSGSPSEHISAALATPASRGSRCVPPAPGMMPSFTSG